MLGKAKQQELVVSGSIRKEGRRERGREWKGGRGRKVVGKRRERGKAETWGRGRER